MDIDAEETTAIEKRTLGDTLGLTGQAGSSLNSWPEEESRLYVL